MEQYLKLKWDQSQMSYNPSHPTWTEAHMRRLHNLATDVGFECLEIPEKEFCDLLCEIFDDLRVYHLGIDSQAILALQIVAEDYLTEFLADARSIAAARGVQNPKKPDFEVIRRLRDRFEDLRQYRFMQDN